MKVISMTGDFGSTLFQEFPTIKNTDEGTAVECPFNGYYCIYNVSTNQINEYHQRTVLAEKKKLFRKSNNDSYKIYFINNGFAKCKGYTPKFSYDVSFYDAPVEVNISYDYTIQVATGRASNFINFIKSNRIMNASNGEVYQKVLNNDVNKIVKLIIGEQLKTQSVYDIESCIPSISEKIRNYLNSNNSNLYNYGLNVNSFSFNISEPYIYHEEKNRVLKDSIIKNNFGEE